MKAGDVLLFLGQHFVIFWGGAIEKCRTYPWILHLQYNIPELILKPTGNAVTHGAAPWLSELPRRVAMLDYLSQHSRLGRL